MTEGIGRSMPMPTQTEIPGEVTTRLVKALEADLSPPEY